jgi:hypothetical protein
MPITGIYWDRNSGRDIHVLRGGPDTRDLTHLSLAFNKPDGTVQFADDYLNQTPDVTITFTPLYKGAPQGDTFVGDNNGIQVNMKNGAVHVPPNATPKIKNFIIEVVATNNADHTSFTEKIRIQVHNTVTQVWLTPDLLTVRPTQPAGVDSQTSYRFAVRAQFDDNVVGDLTEGYGVTWSPADHFQPDGTITILATDIAGNNLFVTATLPAGLGGTSTPDVTTTLRVGERWSNDPSRPKVTLVAGGGLPASGDAENAPNILLLGDGFGLADTDSFDQIADTFIHFIKTSQLTRPYDLLSGSMNMWKVFEPADDIGISFRSELCVLQVNNGGNLQQVAGPIPAVGKAKDGDPWTIENLLYAVGLPVPGDDAPARTPAVLKAEWTSVLQTDPSPHATDDLINIWKRIAPRTFLEERDGFPGMSYGDLPAANLTDMNMLNLHQDRAGIAGLQLMCKSMENDDVQLADTRPIGNLWGENTFRFNNTHLFAVFSSFPGGRAQNVPGAQFDDSRYIALSTQGGNPPIPVKPVAGKNAFQLDMAAVPIAVEADASRILAHELGHSFALNDEYSDVSKLFTDPHADASYGNLTSEKDTFEDPNDPAKQFISGNQIQWTWHRIVAAAVITGDLIDKPGGKVQIPVVPDVSFRFSPGDAVRLRLRRWNEALFKLGANDISPALVVSDPPESDSILVTGVQGAHVTAADLQAFAPGSLLYTPKPAPASVLSAAYPFAEMVAKNVKDAITANKKPLTPVPCVYVYATRNDPQSPILDNDHGQRTPVANVVAGLGDQTRIVGLYVSGGTQFSCAIFHPTGHCMMRQDHEEHAEFCAVCRYIMVDFINPIFHPDTDADYDKIYPLH